MNLFPLLSTNTQNLSEWCSFSLTNLDLLMKKKKCKNIYKISNSKWLDLETTFNKMIMNKKTYIYINNQKFSYNFVEYLCSYSNNSKFSILDFCNILNITIPHYCYHPDLSIAGNCRMCLIQMDGSAKPIASCALTILPNMIINTQSIFVKKIQEVFLNFYF
jgi:hypothetical protein